MSDFKVGITFKGGTGYDAPMVTFHADSIDEAGEMVRDFRQAGHFSRVMAAAAEFTAATPEAVANAQAALQEGLGATPVQPQAFQPPPPQPPAAAQPQGNLSPPCLACGGATMFRSGTSNRGPWSAYFCVATDRLPKGDPNKHKAQWL